MTRLIIIITLFVHFSQDIWGWILGECYSVLVLKWCHLTLTKICLISTSRKRLHCFLGTSAHLSSTWKWTVVRKYNLPPVLLYREQETSWIILPMWVFNLMAPTLMGFTSWGNVELFRYCICRFVIVTLKKCTQYVCSFVSTAQGRVKQLPPCHKCFLCRKTSLMSFLLLWPTRRVPC